MPPILKRQDLIYPELSYKIVGILFDTYKSIGPGYKEKHYQRAVAVALEESGLLFKEQVAIPLMFRKNKIGINFLDFLIEEKIILELKKGDYFDRAAIEQVNQYLKASGQKLALLAAFTSKGVKLKRIVNVM